MSRLSDLYRLSLFRYIPVLVYLTNISLCVCVCVYLLRAAVEETYSKSMTKLAKMASNGSPHG